MGRGSSKAGSSGGANGGTNGKPNGLEKAKDEALQTLKDKGNEIKKEYTTDNDTLLVLVKSNKNNFTIRQSFYSEQLKKYQGFSIVKNLSRYGESLANAEFDDLVSNIKKRKK